jgi:primosomal protein N' (replication factor Y)
LIVAAIAIPRPNVAFTWDYLVPGDLAQDATIGKRVMIRIGKSREVGYITAIKHESQIRNQLKTIDEVLDPEPLVSQELLNLTKWIAEYYLSSWGEVIKAALPAGINPKDEEKLKITSAGKNWAAETAVKGLLTVEERELIDLIDYIRENGPLKSAELKNEFSGNLISKALGNKLIQLHTVRKGRRLEKVQKKVFPVPDPDLASPTYWKKYKKRLEAFEKLSAHPDGILLARAVNDLRISRAIISAMEKDGLLKVKEGEVRRNPFKNLDVKPSDPFKLTDYQQTAFQPVSQALESGEYSSFLLHGVTGSGKTEVYIHLALQCIASGRQVLILIPELSLTPQFVRRYYAVFGEKLAVLHSGLPLGERTDEWNRVRKGEADIVLGTRLSVFAPLKKPGLIIVDEEHDQSYKQDDYPIFHARDVAVVRSNINKAVCLLGSATPALESIYNVKKGKYKLLELKKRVLGRSLPELNLIDLRDPDTSSEDNFLPTVVIKEMEETLKKGEQSLVMVGRKGYAPFVICRACGHNFECPSCSITMSWHEAIEKMKCHYCGKIQPLKGFCPKCGSQSIETLGQGTAKVEEKLKALFPQARVGRMDRDVITKPWEYQQILDALRKKEIDILVGTQMIAKGHDYPNVTTVVAMGMDSILKLPDFRHSERLFQLITQVSGRAGRGERPGKVFILSYRTSNYAIKAAANRSWEEFLERELQYRYNLRYPPYGFMALLQIEDFNKNRGKASAQKVVELLYEKLQNKAIVLGPALAPYARLKNRWRYQVIIKAPDRSGLNKALRETVKEANGPSVLKINIDPVSVM